MRVAASAVSERPSVAVLPFESMSAGKGDEYFSAGITEELIGTLNRLGRLRVPSLVRVTNDSTLWADDLDRAGGDVLALEAEIAGAIATHLLSTLLPSDRASLEIHATVNPEAHDRYLRGRFYWNQRTPHSLLEAVKFFREALVIDPGYARAYAGLADTYSLLPWTASMPVREAAPLAREAAQHALRLDSTLSDAHVSLGIVQLFFGWNPDRAEREFTRAVALDSTNANAYLFLTWVACVRGRLDEALVAL